MELDNENAESPLMKKGEGRSPALMRSPNVVAAKAIESWVVGDWDMS